MCFFKTHFNEFNEFNCLVSMDRLFHCLSVDGNKRFIEQAFSGSDVSEVLCISKVILRDFLFELNQGIRKNGPRSDTQEQ